MAVYLCQVLGLEYRSYVSPPPGNKQRGAGMACAWSDTGFSLSQRFAKCLIELFDSLVSLACLVSLCQQRKTGCCLFPSPALLAARLVFRSSRCD